MTRASVYRRLHPSLVLSLGTDVKAASVSLRLAFEGWAYCFGSSVCRSACACNSAGIGRAAKRPRSGSRQVAEAGGLNQRYLREWLNAMTTARFVRTTRSCVPTPPCRASTARGWSTTLAQQPGPGVLRICRCLRSLNGASSGASARAAACRKRITPRYNILADRALLYRHASTCLKPGAYCSHSDSLNLPLLVSLHTVWTERFGSNEIT
jgi:hypothetical protein